MTVYGEVGGGITGANSDLLTSIQKKTDGGRRFVIAAGDFNIAADELEASGLLDALGLTLVRPEGVDITCTSGKGAMLDYVLVTTRFATAVVSVKAVQSVPWGPHYGIRVMYRTDTADIMAPEVVRPPKLEKPVDTLRRLGWVEENPNKEPTMTWEEARKLTQSMVDNSLKKVNKECDEYTERI